MRTVEAWLFEPAPTFVRGSAGACGCARCRQGLRHEAEWEVASTCPPAGQTLGPFVISRFSRYSLSLRPAERPQVDQIARSIVMSFGPGCRPIRTVRLVGHADRDPVRERREPGFERKISGQRAEAVREAIIRAIADSAPLKQVTF